MSTPRRPAARSSAAPITATARDAVTAIRAIPGREKRTSGPVLPRRERSLRVRLPTGTLLSKHRRARAGRKLSKAVESAPSELRAEALGRHIDRRLRPAREAEDDKAARREHPRQLIEER